MFVPEPPKLGELERITPTIYEASMRCMAKAAWYAFGQRDVLPEHPAAILGTCFHRVVAAAHYGGLKVANEADRVHARQLFDITAQESYDGAHPLLRLKFPSLDRLPYYNLHRERTALLATQIAALKPSSGIHSARVSSESAALGALTESRLSSTDGVIVGRPDHLDARSGTVFDYKSGHVTGNEVDKVSESEARQLRLYAYLAKSNGIPVSMGVIVRGDGRRCEMPISIDEADTEAMFARSKRQALNNDFNAKRAFIDLTSPSSEGCRLCPCIPFCDSFWQSAGPEWGPQCGLQVEGEVLNAEVRTVQSVSLANFALSVRRGTLRGEHASVEQIPASWMTIQGDVLPSVGDLIRIVHCRQSGTAGNDAVLRADKTLTTVWTVPTGDRPATDAVRGKE